MSKSKASDTPDAVKPGAAKKPNPAARVKRKGQDFGLEGTNKTVPTPLPDGEPTGELQGTKSKFVPKTPYTRG